MQRNLDELERLNKQLEEYLLADVNDEHIGFNKLVMVEFTDPKLREALILLHSKYVAEMEGVKKYHYKYLNDIININKNICIRITAIKEELAKEILIAKSKREVSVPKVVIMALSLVFVFGSLFYMFTIDKEAGAMLVDIIKHSLRALVENKDIIKE